MKSLFLWKKVIYTDISLFYEERGQGEALLLLHGNGESHAYFEHQLSHFADRYRVIAPDTRGHGRSPRGCGEFSIRRFSEDLHDFMRDLGIQSAHLLGFSDGGNIALEFALRHPDMVKSLILNGANLYPRGMKFSVRLPIGIEYRLNRFFGDDKDKAELLGLMVNEPQIAAETLTKLTMPVLVIAGTRDMIRKKHTELIARSLPNAKLVFLPGSHFVAQENPEAFNRAVDEFLSSNGI